MLLLLATPASAHAQGLEQAVTELGSDDAKQRAAAREKLLAGGEPAVKAMVAYLEDVTIRLADRVAQLIRQLRDRRWSVRERATRSLEAIGAPALSALEEASKSGDPEVAWRAKKAAKTVRAKHKGEAERRRRRREAVVSLLSTIGSPLALTVLARELETPGLAPTAAFGLGRIGRPEAAPGLIKALRGADWLLRNNVTWALGATGSPTAIPPLLALGKDTEANRYLRMRAIRALRRLARAHAAQTRPVATGLVALLADPAWEVRATAAGALRRIAGKSLGYAYDAPEDQREKAAADWRKWAAALPSGGEKR